jgi:Protein of unknown function (DUF669)
MAQLSFNARNVEPSQGFEPVPTGEYVLRIIKSDIALTSTRAGQILKLEWEVLDGPQGTVGRHVFTRINVQNQNQQAEEIGQRELSALCHSVGILDLQDTQQLHGIPVRCRVKLTPAAKDKNGVERDAQNEITKYAPATTATPNQPQAAPQGGFVPPAQPVPAAPPATYIPPPAAAPQPWQQQAPAAAPTQGTPPWASRK